MLATLQVKWSCIKKPHNDYHYYDDNSEEEHDDDDREDNIGQPW